MGERPTPDFIEREHDSSTGSSTPDISRSLELAAMSTAARGLLDGSAPTIIGGDERVGDPLGLERAVKSIVFGPTQTEFIPAGRARLIASLGATEGNGKRNPQEKRDRNSGRENGTQKGKLAA